MYLLHAELHRHVQDELACPFSDGATNVCAASLSSMIIGPHNRKEYCLSENYDSCPMFLAKVMRKK